jgi:hypothetical protein
MRQITIKIKDTYYTLFLQFLKSLTYVEIAKEETADSSISVSDSDERRKAIDFILSYHNDKPTFRDAAEWQHNERTDRELPFNE